MNNVIILKAESDDKFSTFAYPLTASQKKYILLINRDFSGRIEIHCRQGGIARIDKIEQIKVDEPWAEEPGEEDLG